MDGAISVKRLCDYPEYAEMAAQWFAARWDIPIEDYRESIRQSIVRSQEIPQWYVVLDDLEYIIAGAGIIANDFHCRKDLSPNLCALFVAEPYRRKGVARHLLDFARRDISSMGFERLYLITDHIGFYEKCGWDFLAIVGTDEGGTARMYAASAVK